MTSAYVPTRVSRCRGHCTAALRLPDHHDRMLAIDTDDEAMFELLEIAVTWHELDYSGCALLGPADWLTFARAHRWAVPDRAERVLSLALDMVGRSAAGPMPVESSAPLAELVRA